jgi:DNA-binding response OmpR family regulator
VPGKFLLASTDDATRALVRRAFSEFAIEPEECAGVMEAFSQVPGRHYDGVVLDCEDVDLALQLLTGLRAEDAAERTNVIALLPTEVPLTQALVAGAKLALHKPLKVERVSLSLRVSFGLVRVKDREKDKEKDKDKVHS